MKMKVCQLAAKCKSLFHGIWAHSSTISIEPPAQEYSRNYILNSYRYFNNGIMCKQSNRTTTHFSDVKLFFHTAFYFSFFT
jgi:hypothetical protein